MVDDHDAMQAAEFRVPLMCLHAFCSNEMENCVRMSKLSHMKMTNNSLKMSLNSLVNDDGGDGDRDDHDENEIFDPMYHDHDGFDGYDDVIEIVNFDLVLRFLPIENHAVIVEIRQPAQHKSCVRHGFWMVNEQSQSPPSWHLVHQNQNLKPAWLLLLV